MSRTSRALGGAGLGYLHQAIVMLFGLWLTPFLLARVGQHDFGLWLVAGQVLAYLALLDLGVIAMLPREVAFASGHSNADERDTRLTQLIAQVRIVVRRQFPLLVAGGALIVWQLPAEWDALRRPLALIIGAFVVMYPWRILTATLEGLQELPYLGRAHIAGWVMGTGATLWLVLRGAGLYALASGWIVAQAVPLAAAWWQIRQRHATVLQTPEGTVPKPSGEYLRRSTWVSVSQISQILLAGSDILLLGRLLGPAAVVPYACTGKLVSVFANHPQLLMHVSQPALSQLRAGESKSRLFAVASALTQAMLLMSGAFAIVIFAVNPFFVTWWVGAAQYGGMTLGLAFIGMMLLRHWNLSTAYTLFCFGYERRLSLTSLADGVVTIVTSLVLIQWLGPVGAPLASMIGAATVSLPMNTSAVAREMNVTVWTLVKPVVAWMLRVIPVGAVGAVLAPRLGSASFVGLLAVGAPLAIVYLAVMWPLVMNGPVAPYLRSALPVLNRVLPKAAVLRQGES